MPPTRTVYRRRPRVPHPDVSYDPHMLAALLGGADPDTVRLPVTERTVVGLPAADAALKKIANAVAQMMVAAEVWDGNDIVEPTPTVVERPNWGYVSFTFWREVVTTALMRGNYVALPTDFDDAGWPQQVVPIPIDLVGCTITPDGWVDYEIAGQHYTADEVVHVRLGLTVPGNPWAIGVIEAHRRGLGGMLDQQGMTNDVWRNGAVPSGVVQLDTPNPTPDQVSTVKESWIGVLGGKRTVAVTGKAMTYTPVTWSAEDAQFIEARQFSVAECALMFGLRPSDLDASIGGAGALTYGNRMDDALQRITDAYMPITLPVEQTWTDLLPGRQTARGKAEALLRSTTRERYETHELAQRIGLQTPDETRQIERRPAAPTDTANDDDTPEDPDDDDAS